jgi:hypothetical protein
LDLDLASTFWKLMLRESLDEDDLQSFDYTAWSTLKFKDPSTGLEFDEKEFDEIFGELTFTTMLSDGKTIAEVRPGGRTQRVTYKDRHQFAKEAMTTRFHESLLQFHFIKQGLYTIVPRPALALLTWQDLELRVCGEPNVDLKVLQAHTQYRPEKKYDAKSPIVTMFWQVLEGFNAVERAKFLQFAWARTRLPPDMSSERMQLNILDTADAENTLPSAETCFFNVVLPHYKTIEQLKAKLSLAINECTSITF